MTTMRARKEYETHSREIPGARERALENRGMQLDSSIVAHAVLAFAQAGRPHMSLQGHPPGPLLSYPAHDRLRTADGEPESKPSSDESSSKLQLPALTHSRPV